LAVTAIARHNLAVLAHTRALDAEFAGTGEQAGQWWSEALRLWRSVQDDDVCWRWLDTRVAQLADPRLAAHATGDLRRALPAALLGINAALAVQALTDQADDRARRQLRLIRESGPPSPAIEQALAAVAEPMVARVRRECKRVTDAVDADPRAAVVATGDLIQQTIRPLRVLDSLYPAGHPVRDGAHDEVALRLLTCSVVAHRETSDDRAAQEVLRHAQQIAATAPAVARVRENVEIIDQNLLWGSCWFCGAQAGERSDAYVAKMYGDVNRERVYNGTRTTWKTGSVNIPRCPACRQRRASESSRHGLTIFGIVAFAILAVVLLCTPLRWYGALVSAALAIGVGIAGRGVMRAASAERTRVVQFPAVADQLGKGWHLGEKPSTS
jgi:hypothetical protein